MLFTTDLLLLSILGIGFFVFVLLRFVDLIGKEFPIKELIITLMLLQMVVCPIITYNYFNNEVLYRMELGEESYLRFVLLSVSLFCLGLFVRLPNYNPILIKSSIGNLFSQSSNNSKIGVALIAFSFISTLISKYVPSYLAFVFYLFEQFKFVGVFYLLYSNNSFLFGWFVVVFGFFTYQTVTSGLFINLFCWVLLLFLIAGFKYKLTFLSKFAIFFFGVFLAFFVQSFKKEYREVIWEENKTIYESKYDSKKDAFIGMASEKLQDSDDFYEYSNINRFISRLNQGWILTKVINHVPFYEPFSNGERLKSELYAVIVPRILDPHKTTSSGTEGQEKFERFTGKRMIGSTRMTIGVLGDAYVNFGMIGGAIFMFCFGLFLNIGVNSMLILAKNYPSLLLWIPFVFAISMRAGNEFLPIVNYISKSAFVVFVVFWLFNSYFKFDKIKN